MDRRLSLALIPHRSRHDASRDFGDVERFERRISRTAPAVTPTLQQTIGRLIGPLAVASASTRNTAYSACLGLPPVIEPLVTSRLVTGCPIHFCCIRKMVNRSSGSPRSGIRLGVAAAARKTAGLHGAKMETRAGPTLPPSHRPQPAATHYHGRVEREMMSSAIRRAKRRQEKCPPMPASAAGRIRQAPTQRPVVFATVNQAAARVASAQPLVELHLDRVKNTPDRNDVGAVRTHGTRALLPITNLSA